MSSVFTNNEIRPRELYNVLKAICGACWKKKKSENFKERERTYKVKQQLFSFSRLAVSLFDHIKMKEEKSLNVLSGATEFESMFRFTQ